MPEKVTIEGSYFSLKNVTQISCDCDCDNKYIFS